MKKLFIVLFSIGLTINISAQETPEQFGKKMFEAVKNNDLNAFKELCVTVNQIKQAMANGSLNVPVEDRADIISYFEETLSSPGIYIEFLEDLREREGWKERAYLSPSQWENASFESVYYEKEDEGSTIHYDMTVTFLIDKQRHKIDEFCAMKIIYYDKNIGKRVSKFVLSDYGG